MLECIITNTKLTTSDLVKFLNFTINVSDEYVIEDQKCILLVVELCKKYIWVIRVEYCKSLKHHQPLHLIGSNDSSGCR